MFIKFFLVLINMFLFTQSYGEPPFESLRTCIDTKPYNESIKLTRLEGEGPSKVNDGHCKDQYDREYEGHVYGTVSCDDSFYFIINDQKISPEKAINKSINPEIKPGYPLTKRALWYKIDQGNKSYLCIEDSLSESGAGGSQSQYYLVDNAFEPKTTPIIYYYFFEKNIVPITSEHL